MSFERKTYFTTNHDLANPQIKRAQSQASQLSRRKQIGLAYSIPHGHFTKNHLIYVKFHWNKELAFKLSPLKRKGEYSPRLVNVRRIRSSNFWFLRSHYPRVQLGVVASEIDLRWMYSHGSMASHLSPFHISLPFFPHRLLKSLVSLNALFLRSFLVTLSSHAHNEGFMQ